MLDTGTSKRLLHLSCVLEPMQGQMFVFCFTAYIMNIYTQYTRILAGDQLRSALSDCFSTKIIPSDCF